MNLLSEDILDVIFRNKHEMMFCETIEKIQQFNYDAIINRYLEPAYYSGEIRHIHNMNNEIKMFVKIINSFPDSVIRNLIYEAIISNHFDLQCLYSNILSLKHLEIFTKKPKTSWFGSMIKYAYMQIEPLFCRSE